MGNKFPINSMYRIKINKKIHYTNEFTVRMLLNHSTGLPDYAEDKIYVVDLLQNPLKKFTIEDFVSYIVEYAGERWENSKQENGCCRNVYWHPQLHSFCGRQEP